MALVRKQSLHICQTAVASVEIPVEETIKPPRENATSYTDEGQADAGFARKCQALFLREPEVATHPGLPGRNIPRHLTAKVPGKPCTDVVCTIHLAVLRQRYEKT